MADKDIDVDLGWIAVDGTMRGLRQTYYQVRGIPGATLHKAAFTVARFIAAHPDQPLARDTLFKVLTDAGLPGSQLSNAFAEIKFALIEKYGAHKAAQILDTQGADGLVIFRSMNSGYAFSEPPPAPERPQRFTTVSVPDDEDGAHKDDDFDDVDKLMGFFTPEEDAVEEPDSEPETPSDPAPSTPVKAPDKKPDAAPVQPAKTAAAEAAPDLSPAFQARVRFRDKGVQTLELGAVAIQYDGVRGRINNSKVTLRPKEIFVLVDIFNGGGNKVGIAKLARHFSGKTPTSSAYACVTGIRAAFKTAKVKNARTIIRTEEKGYSWGGPEAPKPKG